MTPSASFGRIRLLRHRLESVASRLKKGRCTCEFAAREISRIQTELADIDADLDTQPDAVSSPVVEDHGRVEAEAVVT